MGDVANTNCRVCRRAPVFRMACIVAMLGLAVLPGCVRRRLNVRTNPPGALVYVDNQQIGTTPCSVDFTYYGTREIRMIKPGYETLTVNQPIPTPWYQIPPLDFVSENLVPYKIRDNRTVTFDMAPQLIVPKEQLLGRANELRQDVQQFQVMPASAVGTSVPVGPPTVVAPAGPPLGPPTVVMPSTVPPGPFPPATTAPPVIAPPGASVPFPPAATSPPSGGTIVAPP